MSSHADDPPRVLEALRIAAATPDATTVVLAVSGELDLATAPLLEDRIAGVARRQLLVVDLTAVSFLGVAGITVLLRHRARAVEHYTRFRLVADNRPVLRPLYLLDLADAFDIHPTIADALISDLPRC